MGLERHLGSSKGLHSRREEDHSPHREARATPNRTEAIERMPTSVKTSISCFYCGRAGHPPKLCNEYPTREGRIEVIKSRILCRNCGEADHQAARCLREACRICNEVGHHTSICRKGPSAPPHSLSSRQVPSKRPPNQRDTRLKSLRKPPATKTNCVISKQEDREETVVDTVLHVGSDKHQPDSLILVGQALVFNP
ncbi:unnamed protein product [Nippostrongylus brasiliensis]|uniref:CCHC-type domain-containing protein n=1 Tax=Nippostrongylus brasiliensis TaxID=27835 RepID=A0A0N4YKA8_NIPBR|nr:unnamed protein product [Nippostrongylus brasiliensis]